MKKSFTKEHPDVLDLQMKGYQALTLGAKEYPPPGVTGAKGEVRYESSGSNFIAIRHYDTFALDIDTDDTAKHQIENPQLAEQWAEFLQRFEIVPVVTGANTFNHAGIYHFAYGAGVTEDMVKVLNRIPGVDVIRKGHRYAVVRGTHPKTGKAYAGDLPHRAELPVFTTEHLQHLMQHVPDVKTPESWKATSQEQWQTPGEMCKVVSEVAARFYVPEGASRHDTYRDVLYRLACLGAAGHAGVLQATEELAQQWEDTGKSAYEFQRLCEIKRLPREARADCRGARCKGSLSAGTHVDLISATNPVYALESTSTAVHKYLQWSGNRWNEFTKIQLKGELSYQVPAGMLTNAFQVLEARASTNTVPLPEVGVLHCSNGVLDIATGEFARHSRDNVPGLISGIEFDPSAKCPRFANEFLPAFSGGDDEVANWLLAYFKHVLMGGNRFEKFLILYGNGGTGKGTMVEIISTILGDYATALNGAHLKQQGYEFNAEAPSPALAKIEGKRLVIVDEIPEAVRLLDAAKIKAITGKSQFSVRDLHQSARSVTYTGQMIISTNRLPQFKDDVEGIDRRVILYSTPDRAGEQDDTLKADIVSNELPGVLDMILSADDWTGKSMPLPTVIAGMTQDYIDNMSVIRAFVEQSTTPVQHRSDGSTLKDLYPAFESFTQERRDGNAINRTAFKEGLQRLGITFEKTGGYYRCMAVLTEEALIKMEDIENGW